MKKVIKSVKLIVFMLGALSASGSNMIPKFDVINNGIDCTSEVKTTEVVIKNAKGKIIFQDTVSKIETLPEDFNLSELSDGSYTIEWDRAFEIKVKPFTVIYNQVIFDSKNSYSIFKPVITIKGKLVYLTRLSFNKKNLKVKVYDVENNLIYSERIEEEVQLKRIYDFSKTSGKKFKVVLKTEGKTFVQNIEF